MKFSLSAIALLLLAVPLAAQVPNLVPHQGRVAVNGVNFDGTGQFKFALVNAAGSTTYWSNNGTSTVGSQPTAAVSLPVTKGLYSVLLGDTALANMSTVPASVYANADLRLRVWFNNGTLGFQQLTPDQRIAPNGYLPDGAVTSAKLAPGASPPPVVVTGTSHAAVANGSYVATAAGHTVFTLPATASAGDRIHISGTGSGGWTAPGGDEHWNWRRRQVVGAGNLQTIASSADGLKLFTAGSGTDVFSSADQGATWQQRFVPFGESWRSVCASADGTRLAVAGHFPPFVGALLYSLDSGGNWTRVPIDQGGTGAWTSIACSSDGTKFVAGQAIGRIYTSTNGATWTGRHFATDWTGVCSSADGQRLAAVSFSGTVARSTNAGATWTDFALFPSLRAVACSADGTRLIAAAEGGKLHLSSDGGSSWASGPGPLAWTSVASSADGSRLAAVAKGNGGTVGSVYSSADFGQTWRRWFPPTQSATGEWTGVSASADGRRLAICNADGELFTSEGIVASGLAGGGATLIYNGTAWRREGAATQSVESQEIADGAVTAAKLGPDVARWHTSATGIYRSTGNVGIGTDTPNYPLSFGTSVANTKLALWDGHVPYGLGIQAYQFRLHLNDAGARFSFLSAPDGSELMTILGTGQVGIGTPTPSSALQVVGTVTATAFNPASDRNLKENFQPVDAGGILEKVAALPISRWTFKDDAGTEHIGPMAQDFHSAFRTGTDDRHIATVDADGVALAAIKGLNEKLEDALRARDAELDRLRGQNEALETRLAALEALLRSPQPAPPNRK